MGGYAEIIARFINQFQDHTIDNLRIMMHVLVSGGFAKMDKLIELLRSFEARDLTYFFYKIYYQYAHTVLSVSLLLDDKLPNSFCDLAWTLPIGVSQKDWPMFERFFLHAMCFTRQYSLFEVYRYKDDSPFSPLDCISSMRDYWKTLYNKCLHYANNQVQDAEHLMTMLVQHIVQADGLSIAPFRNPKTFFDGLACLLDQAMAAHTLHEQLSEIRGLSLLWLDAPMAMTHHGFKVVSEEMEITAGQLNPMTKSYAVSSDALLDVLATPSYVSARELKILCFRYLGTETARESLAFYRQLCASFCPSSDDETHYLQMMIFAYFIVNSTGDKYTPRIDRIDFSAAMKDFFVKNGKDTASFDACLDAFFEQYEGIPNDREMGLVSLWHFCPHSIRVAQMPLILTKKFEQKKRVHFILAHQAEIVAAIQHVVDEVGVSSVTEWLWLLLRAMIHEHCSARGVRLEKLPYRLVQHAYPMLTPAAFFNEFAKMERFIEQYVDLIQGYEGIKLYAAFRTLIDQRKSQGDGVDVVLVLMNMLSRHNNRQYLKQNILFLDALAQHNELLNEINRAEPLLKCIAHTVQTQWVEPMVLNRLFTLASMVLMDEPNNALYVLKRIIHTLHIPEWRRFLCRHEFNASQLQGICVLLDHYHLPISFIEWSVHSSQRLALNDIVQALTGLHMQQIPSLLTVWYSIEATLFEGDTVEPLTVLKALVALPAQVLDQWSALIKHQQITLEQSLALLGSPSIVQTLRVLIQQQYTMYLERYAFDKDAVREKISSIRCLLPNHAEGVALPMDVQADLLSGYEMLMSYLSTRPIFIECDAEGCEHTWTVHQLSEEQYPMVYQQLKQRIQAQDDEPHHKIKLLALACKMVYHIMHHLPRDTQLLSVLHTIYHPSGERINNICEIRTGEGKSLIAALYVVLFSVYGAVDVVTENDQLAMNGLNKYRQMFNALHIPCRQETEYNIIEANSTRRQYLDQGVNYGTLANLTLYRMQMRLNSQPLPSASLVCDEIDAALTSTVSLRLATSIHPFLQDTTSWSLIYRAILAFVNDRTLFLDNQCRKTEDVENLRHYLQVQFFKEPMASLLNQVPNEMLEMLIESALTAKELPEEEGVDFLAVPDPSPKGGYYAAPILENTKRPDPQVSYSEGVQQLLHTLLSSEHRTFPIAPITETIIILSIKNAIDHYLENGSRLIGLTGTGGSCIERQEFIDLYGLPVIRYPSFYPDRCELLPLHAVNSAVEQREAMITALQINQDNNPTQPVVIIMPSPKEASELCEALTSAFNRPVFNYHGDKSGEFEQQLIHQAGLDGAITVATQSLARGADIETKHPKGTIIFNGCTDVNHNDYFQIKGRTARNGHPGQFSSIIRLDLMQRGDDHLSLDEQFKHHQYQISEMRQRERLKTRLLNDARNRIIQYYFFSLKERGDALLRRQCGQWSTLIDMTDFLTTLRDFNHRAETHYHTLLGDKDQLNGVETDQFLDSLVKEYQMALNRWLPKDKFQSFQAVEPLVALESLEKLDALNPLIVDDLRILSALLSHGWSYVGHQGMYKVLQGLEACEHHFEPYFKGQCGFKSATAGLLIQQNMLDLNKVQVLMDKLLQDMIDGTGQLRALPVIGYFIPIESIQAVIIEYMDQTKRQIQEEQWEALALPKIDFKAIEDWFSGLQTAATIVSYCGALSTGPLSFILQQIVLPALAMGLKALLKLWFAESDVLYVQMLLGLDSILSDTRKALEFLLSQPSLHHMTVGEVLAHFTPLLTNKTFLALMRYGLEKNGYAAWIPYMQQGVAFIPALAPYHQMRWVDLQQGDKLLAVFLSVCQLELVQQTLEQTGFKEEVARIPDLTPDVLASFHQLNVQGFIGCMKLMIHPEWNACLQAMPKGTTLDQMRLWLSKQPGIIPVEAQLAIERLNEYQLNSERMAEHTRVSLLSLHAQYDVSTAGLKNQLAKCPQNTNRASPTVTPACESISPWRMIGYIVMGTAVIVVNIVFFSIPLLITTALLGLMLAYRYSQTGIHKHGLFSVQQNVEKNNTPKERAGYPLPNL